MIRQGKASLLLVDDDPDLLRLLSIRLKANQYDVTAVDTHDDQISVAFGRHEDFTMSLAMPDERFRRAAVAKVVGDERLQLVPCRRFGRLPVFHELARFVPRELLERRSRWLVPRPLDDVEERHAGPRLLRQRPGPLER